ncbi:Ubiquitin-like-specific protease 2 [Trichinella pseudospiralis]|uniref:Ubiquitin-like-specific protease 2 n=1 Tax=Trichinella pseudospiralis TaxID=6337 RepID=A0A0V0XXJ0_TRIPS|nr:Ubiquitin-like-specific protease 2 [Trichinella pseudospiralis]
MEVFFLFLFSLMTNTAGGFGAVDLVGEDKKLDFMISKRLLSKIECHPDVVEAALQASPTRQHQRQRFGGGNQSYETGQRLAIRYNDVDCITLYEEHLTCLLFDNWLNDEVVDFFMVLLLELLNDYKNYDFCFLPASFLESIKRGRDHCVLRRLNVFEKKFILIPVCHNFHWTLVILCYMNNMEAALNGHVDADCSPFMLFVDSLHWNINRRILVELRHSFSRELGIRLNVPDFKLGDNELPYKTVRVPKQKNLSDCGVYLLHYTECFIRYAVQKTFNVKQFLEESFKFFELSSGASKRENLRNTILYQVVNLFESYRHQMTEARAFYLHHHHQYFCLFIMNCSESGNGRLPISHDWNSDEFFQRTFCSLLLLKTKQQLAFSGSVEFGLLLGRCHVFGFELEASIPPKFQQVFSSYYGSPLVSFNTGKRTIDQSKISTHEFSEFCYVNFLKPLITKAMMKRIRSAAAVLIIRCVQLPLALGTSFERMSMIEPQNCATNNPSTIAEKRALIPGIFLVTKKTKLHAFSLTSKEAVLFDKTASQAQRFAKSERYSILFCGHIASGKSTRVKYFANRLLSRRVKTYLLDLDLGQNEMTLPGCISLTKLDEPLYGLGLDILLSVVDSLKPNKIFFFENCNIEMGEAAASRVARVALEERTQIKFVRTSHLRANTRQEIASLAFNLQLFCPQLQRMG